MLSFVMKDIHGSEILFPPALSVEINMDEDVPADSLLAVFPLLSTEELQEVAVLDDGETVFVGIVDELERVMTASGVFLRVSARSLAAHLLDNEAMPQSYDHPSAQLIFDRHARGYGLRRGEDDDAAYFGELTVIKGTSQWSVIENFCNACYSSKPRVSADGALYMKDREVSGEVVFSDADDGVRYTAVTEKIKRCEEISRVNVKLNSADGYSYPMLNADAVRRGIRRERYLNAMLAATPMTCADAMIARGRGSGYCLSLECPVRLLRVIGCGAAVHSHTISAPDGLYISAIRYRMTAQGETTHVKLKRRNV